MHSETIANHQRLPAAGFPAAAQRMESVRIPNLVFYIGKHFGTGKSSVIPFHNAKVLTWSCLPSGVILSTAFIHLLSDAFVNLHGLQLGSYSNWAGTIV